MEIIVSQKQLAAISLIIRAVCVFRVQNKSPRLCAFAFQNIIFWSSWIIFLKAPKSVSSKANKRQTDLYDFSEIFHSLLQVRLSFASNSLLNRSSSLSWNRRKMGLTWDLQRICFGLAREDLRSLFCIRRREIIGKMKKIAKIFGNMNINPYICTQQI